MQANGTTPYGHCGNCGWPQYTDPDMFVFIDESVLGGLMVQMVGPLPISQSSKEVHQQIQEEISRDRGSHTLGVKGHIPSGYIVGTLWVLEQFAHHKPSG